MAIPFLSDVDFNQNRAKNFALDIPGSAPSAPVSFQMYGKTATGYPMYWNPVTASWRPLDAAALTDGSIQIAALAVDPTKRQNHTGTQTASTISDLAATVQAYPISSFAAATAPIGLGGYEILNIAQATQSTSATRLDQVQQLIAQAIVGIKTWKDPVRVVFPNSITRSGIPASTASDSVQLGAGDRVLSLGYNDTSDGFYVVQAGAWTRSPDMANGNAVEEGTQVLVAEGTRYGGSTWRVTSSGANQVVGTATLVFQQTSQAGSYLGDNNTITLNGFTFSAKLDTAGWLVSSANGIAIDKSKVPGKSGPFQMTGDNSTKAFTLTHSLNNSNPSVTFFDAGGNAVQIDWRATTANAIVVTFGVAPAQGVVYTAEITG